MQGNNTFQGEQDLQHQNTEADARKVMQVQNVIIGAAPTGIMRGVPNVANTAQQNPEQIAMDISAMASVQSQPHVASPNNSNQNNTSEINKLLSDSEVKAIHDEIKNFKEPSLNLYVFLGLTALLLCLLLWILVLAFNNIDASIAVYVCAAIAVMGIFLIYMIAHLAKHLFKLYNKYQIEKFDLLIDYAKDINKIKNNL